MGPNQTAEKTPVILLDIFLQRGPRKSILSQCPNFITKPSRRLEKLEKMRQCKILFKMQ